MEYEELQPLSRSETERLLRSEDPDAVCRAMVSAALYDPDRRWVEDWCVRLARDPRSQVRGCAATSIGHLARIHGELDRDVVIPLLEELQRDPEMGGLAEDALHDMHVFVSQSDPHQ